MKESHTGQSENKLLNILSLLVLVTITFGLAGGILCCLDLLFSNFDFYTYRNYLYQSDLDIELALLLAVLMWWLAFQSDWIRSYLERIPFINSMQSRERQADFRKAKWFLMFFLGARIVFSIVIIVRDLL